MKYRLIIVDDEAKIIQLIKQLGHWEELGIEIIDECRSGDTAYESIVKNKPDLVLSDIKMPVYDGIELIRMLRDEEVDPFFILLSGYRHFEYARSAIQLNVIDYLLKPIDEEQLNQTLKKACACIEENRLRQEESSFVTALKKDENNRRQKNFWRYLTETDKADMEKGWTKKDIWQYRQFPYNHVECREQFGMDLSQACFRILCIFSNLSSLLGWANSVGNQKIENFISECFSKIAEVYYHTTYMGYIILLNYEKEKETEIIQAVHALYYHILDLSELYGEIRLNIGISLRKVKLLELAEAFQESHDAEWSRLIFAGNGVLFYDQLSRFPRGRISDLISEEEIAILRDAVKYLKIEEMSELAGRVCKRTGTFNTYNPRVFVRLFDYLKEMMMEEFIAEEQRKDRFTENFYYAYLNAANYQQALRGAFMEILRYMEEEKEQLKEKMEKPVSIAVQYIREHYQDQISLEEAAEAGGVSPGYLSKLFKTETGEGFLDYLTELRLKESEKLLAETNLSIKEIAGKVGYLDEKYYSKLFKKTTGIKPSEYRRIYS